MLDVGQQKDESPKILEPRRRWHCEMLKVGHRMLKWWVSN